MEGIHFFLEGNFGRNGHPDGAVCDDYLGRRMITPSTETTRC